MSLIRVVRAMLRVDCYRINGFTLIEVLISMIILGIGLLGLAVLQGVALRDNRDAYFYSQASLLAYEMSDRIKANSDYWKLQNDGSLNVVPLANQGNGCNSSGSVCSPAEMAAFDMYYWEDSARKILPEPSSGQIVGVQRGSCTGEFNADISILCLTVSWARTNQRATGDASPLHRDVTYQLEITPS